MSPSKSPLDVLVLYKKIYPNFFPSLPTLDQNRAHYTYIPYTSLLKESCHKSSPQTYLDSQEIINVISKCRVLRSLSFKDAYNKVVTAYESCDLLLSSRAPSFLVSYLPDDYLLDLIMRACEKYSIEFFSLTKSMVPGHVHFLSGRQAKLVDITGYSSTVDRDILSHRFLMESPYSWSHSYNNLLSDLNKICLGYLRILFFLFRFTLDLKCYKHSLMSNLLSNRMSVRAFFNDRRCIKDMLDLETLKNQLETTSQSHEINKHAILILIPYLPEASTDYFSDFNSVTLLRAISRFILRNGHIDFYLKFHPASFGSVHGYSDSKKSLSRYCQNMQVVNPYESFQSTIRLLDSFYNEAFLLCGRTSCLVEASFLGISALTYTGSHQYESTTEAVSYPCVDLESSIVDPGDIRKCQPAAHSLYNAYIKSLIRGSTSSPEVLDCISRYFLSSSFN